jgi:hypothetical protein
MPITLGVTVILILAPWLMAVGFGLWGGWEMWRWEGRLVAAGRLPHRRWLTRRGPELARWPWQSWKKRSGLDTIDSDPSIDSVRRRVILASKLTDAALVLTVICWAYSGIR